MVDRPRLGIFRGSATGIVLLAELAAGPGLAACSSAASSPSTEPSVTGTVATFPVWPSQSQEPFPLATASSPNKKIVSCLNPSASDRAGVLWQGPQTVKIAPGHALIISSKPGAPGEVKITTPKGSAITVSPDGSGYAVGLETGEGPTTVNFTGSGVMACEPSSDPRTQDDRLMTDVSHLKRILQVDGFPNASGVVVRFSRDEIVSNTITT